MIHWIVKNYVPHTLETMYPELLKPGTPYSRNHVPCTFEIMHFHQRIDNKVE